MKVTEMLLRPCTSLAEYGHTPKASKVQSDKTVVVKSTKVVGFRGTQLHPRQASQAYSDATKDKYEAVLTNQWQSTKVIGELLGLTTTGCCATLGKYAEDGIIERRPRGKTSHQGYEWRLAP